MWRFFDKALSLLSGEWLLRARANGGTVILARALIIASLLFLIGIGVDQRLTPGATWRFDLPTLLLAIREHLTWFTAIFAGAYAALYARFASQWTYLAGLYNHIMSTQAKSPKTEGTTAEETERRRVYNNWMAGFIEDAENLHLALKPIYAALIKDMLSDEHIRNAFVSNTTGGRERLERLEEKVNAVVSREEASWRTRALKRAAGNERTARVTGDGTQLTAQEALPESSGEKGAV